MTIGQTRTGNQSLHAHRLRLATGLALGLAACATAAAAVPLAAPGNGWGDVLGEGQGGFWLPAVPFVGAAADVVKQQVLPRQGVLNFRSGDVDTAQSPNDLNDGDGAFDSRWRVMVLDGPMNPQRRDSLEDLGVRFGDYLPTNAFVVELSRTTRAALRGLGIVTWAGVFQTAWKIDPEIGVLPMVTPERQAIAAAGRVALNVVLFPGQDLTAIKAVVLAIPGAVVHRTDFSVGTGRLVVEVPAGAVEQLAALPEVQMVEDAEEWTTRSTTTVRWIMQTNVAGQTPFYAVGITGAGQVAGHLDTAVAESQCGFDDSVAIGPSHRKIRADFAPGASSHGTQTAGIMLGHNLANPTDGSTGVAYGSKLVHDAYPSLDTTSVGDKFEVFYTDYGAAVHCNSWGQDFTTAYKAGVREIDRFSFENDDNLVVFAATNVSGALYIPENAKNALAVSGTSQSPSQRFWGVGGTGPTVDGRRKPELMAPGKNFFAPALPNVNGNCAIVSQAPSGTSFACPAVSGAALLTRQYFMEGFYPTGVKVPEHAMVPSGALLKAVLSNSGDAMQGEAGYPSNRTGWGRVLMDTSLFLPGDARTTLVRDVRNGAATSLTTGGSGKVLFRVNSNQLLRVTLCWHDYPASVNSTFAPVNNLDLVVADPSNTTYLGNSFSGGFSTTGGSADTINNLEQVHLASPSPGVWSVQVNGAAVQMLSQGYALAISGDISACLADVNQDGAIDLDDFFQFFNDFDNSNAGADIDSVPGVDLADFFAFLNAFDAGC